MRYRVVISLPLGATVTVAAAIDASVVKADANRQRGVPSAETINWSNPEFGTRTVREYLPALGQNSQVARRHLWQRSSAPRCLARQQSCPRRP
jgi:hypothetical protein